MRSGYVRRLTRLLRRGRAERLTARGTRPRAREPEAETGHLSGPRSLSGAPATESFASGSKKYPTVSVSRVADASGHKLEGGEPGRGAGAPSRRQMATAASAQIRRANLDAAQRRVAAEGMVLRMNDYVSNRVRVPRGDDFSPSQLAAESKRRKELMQIRQMQIDEDAAFDRFVDAWLRERLRQYKLRKQFDDGCKELLEQQAKAGVPGLGYSRPAGTDAMPLELNDEQLEQLAGLVYESGGVQPEMDMTEETAEQAGLNPDDPPIKQLAMGLEAGARIEEGMAEDSDVEDIPVSANLAAARALHDMVRAERDGAPFRFDFKITAHQGDKEANKIPEGASVPMRLLFPDRFAESSSPAGRELTEKDIPSVIAVDPFLAGRRFSEDQVQSVAVAGEGAAGDYGRFAEDAAATYPPTSEARNPHPTEDPAVLKHWEQGEDGDVTTATSADGVKNLDAVNAGRVELEEQSEGSEDSDGSPLDSRAVMDQYVDWHEQRQDKADVLAMDDGTSTLKFHHERKEGKKVQLPPRLRLKGLLESQRPDLAKIRAAWILESGRDPVPDHKHLMREVAAPPLGEEAFEALRMGADVRGKQGSWEPRDHRLALPGALRDTHKQERNNAIASVRVELERTQGTLLPNGLPMDMLASERRMAPDSPLVRADEHLRAEAAKRGTVEHNQLAQADRTLMLQHDKQGLQEYLSMLELGRVLEPYEPSRTDTEGVHAARRREQEVGPLEVEKKAMQDVAGLDQVPEVAAVGGGQQAMYLTLASVMKPGPQGELSIGDGKFVNFDHALVDTEKKGWFRERVLAAAEKLGMSPQNVEQLLDSTADPARVSGLLEYLEFQEKGMTTIDAWTKAHGSDRVPEAGFGEFSSQEDRRRFQKDLEQAVFRGALANSEEKRVHNRPLIEAIEAQRSRFAVADEGKSAEELAGTSSTSGSAADYKDQAAASAREEATRTNYDYTVRRLRGIVDDLADGATEQEEQLRRVAQKLLQGLPAYAEKAAADDMDELQRRLRKIVLNATADLETVMGRRQISDLALSKLTGASFLGGGEQPPTGELLRKLYSGGEMLKSTPRLGAYQKAAEAHAKALHASEMRALAEEQQAGVLEPGRTELIRTEVEHDGVTIEVDVPKYAVRPAVEDPFQGPLLGGSGAGLGPKGQEAIRAAMDSMLEHADLAELKETTGLTEEQLRNAEFMTPEEIYSLSPEQRQHRQEMLASLLAYMESDSGVSDLQGMLDLLHLGRDSFEPAEVPGAPDILSKDPSIDRVADSNPAAAYDGQWKDELRAELLTGSTGFLPYPMGNKFAPPDVRELDGKPGDKAPEPKDDSSIAIHSERVWLDKLLAKLDAEGKGHMKAAVRLVVGRRFDRLRMQRRVRDYWRAEAESALQYLLEDNQFQLLRDGINPSIFHKALFSVPMDGAVPYGLSSIGIQTDSEVLKFEVRKHMQAGSESESDGGGLVGFTDESAEAVSAAAQVAKALNIAQDEALQRDLALMFGSTPEARKAIREVLGEMVGGESAGFEGSGTGGTDAAAEGALAAAADGEDATPTGSEENPFDRESEDEFVPYMRLYEDLAGIGEVSREGRRLEGWGAAVQASSVGHSAESVLDLHGPQDPNPEHAGRLDLAHPDHPEVIGPQPGVHHNLRKYQVDPSLDVFITTPDEFGDPAVMTAIGSGSAEDFAKNLTRKGTTKAVDASVRELRMEDADKAQFEANTLESMLPVHLQGIKHMAAALQEAASKLSDDEKALIGMESEGLDEIENLNSKVAEYTSKVTAGLAEGKTYAEVFEEVGPFETGHDRSFDDRRAEFEAEALKGTTFDNIVIGLQPDTTGEDPDDESPTAEEQDEIDAVRQMDAAERDEYILKAQKEGTGYWGRMHKRKTKGSSEKQAPAQAVTYPEPSEELAAALNSLSKHLSEYESKHGIDFAQTGVNKIIMQAYIPEESEDQAVRNALKAFGLGSDATEYEKQTALLVYKSRNPKYVDACMRGIMQGEQQSAYLYGDIAASAIAQQAQAGDDMVLSDMPMNSADESEQERINYYMDLRPHGIAPNKGYYDDGPDSLLTVEDGSLLDKLTRGMNGGYQRRMECPDDLHHSRHYTPYHFRLLEAMHHHDLDAVLMMWKHHNRDVGPKDEPDWLGYNIVLDACARAKQLAPMQMVIEDLFMRNVTPTHEHYSLMLKGAVLAERRDMAESLFQRMKTNNISPNVHDFAAMISMHVNEGRYEAAYATYNAMKAQRVRPNTHVFWIMMRKAIEDKRADHLHYLWRTLRLTPQVKPPAEMFDSLINAFADLGQFEDLWDTFYTMRESRYGRLVPSPQTMVLIFNELVSQKRYTEAREMRRIFKGAGYFNSGAVRAQDMDAIIRSFDDAEEAAAIAERARVEKREPSVYSRTYLPETPEELQQMEFAEEQAERYKYGMLVNDQDALRMVNDKLGDDDAMELSDGSDSDGARQ